MANVYKYASSIISAVPSLQEILHNLLYTVWFYYCNTVADIYYHELNQDTKGVTRKRNEITREMVQ